MNAEFNKLLKQMAVRLEGAGMQRGKMMGKCEGCGAEMPMEAKKAGDGEMLCEMCQKQPVVGEAVSKPLYSATVEFKGNSYYVVTHEIPETSTGGKFETAVYPVGKNGKPDLKAKPLYRTVDFTAKDAKADTFDRFVKGNSLKNLIEPSAHDEAVEVEEAKKPKLGSGKRFKNLVKSLDQRDDVDDPEALAAWIGMQKLGKAKFQKLAQKGRKG